MRQRLGPACRPVGAMPVYVDVMPDRLVMDPDAAIAAVADRTRAIVVTHLYGNVADTATIRGDLKRIGREDIGVFLRPDWMLHWRMANRRMILRLTVTLGGHMNAAGDMQARAHDQPPDGGGSDAQRQPIVNEAERREPVLTGFAEDGSADPRSERSSLQQVPRDLRDGT